MNDLESNKFTVNIYDVFANFLPGFMFIGGVIPLLWDSELTSNIGVLEGSLAVFAAFALGGLVQSVGAKLKYYHFRLPSRKFPSKKCEDATFWIFGRRYLPFTYKMNRLKKSKSKEDDDLPLPEQKFFNACKDSFGFDSDSAELNDWGYLFKMCLTHLEASPYNRTLRIQAQHLATRGLYITFAALSVIYALIAIQQLRPIFPNAELSYAFIAPALPYIVPAVLGLGGSYVLYIRSVHFEEDVISYMISEMVLSANSEG